MDGGAILGPWFDVPATIRTEYRIVPANPIMRFACVSDLEEYRELLHDPSCTVVHDFQPIGALDGGSEDAFQLVECTVDGKQRPVRRTARAGAQVHTASLGSEATTAGRPLAISYTHRLLVQRHGHLLHLDISRPTRGLKVQFAFGNCGIRRVNVVDYIASSRQPGLSRLPASGPTPSIALRFDSWVLPKAGVAFVWVLESEITSGHGERLAAEALG